MKSSQTVARGAFKRIVLGAGLAGVAACGSKTSGSPRDAGHDSRETFDGNVYVDSGPPAPASPDVLMGHNDVSRSGANLNETVLTTSNVSSTTFGALFKLLVDGIIYAQPLFVSGYSIGGVTHNVVIVATMNNSVYAFDADTPGNPLWKVNLGPIVPSSVIRTLNIQVGVGILSTPVIDRQSGLIYLTCKTYDAASNVQTQSLHVLDLATGADVKGSPVVIAATIPGMNDAGPTTLTYNAFYQAQRPALLLLNGTVFLAFASHEDHMPFHGWILGYQYNASAGTLAQTYVFNTTPDGTSGGIWQGGQGLLTDGTSIYMMVANGSVTVPFGGQSYGQSFLKVKPAPQSGSPGTLSVEDWFIPDNWQPLNVGDEDLGSGGPVMVPGTRLLVGGGKEGTMYVVDTANMGHYNAMDDAVVQEWAATNSIYGSPVVWPGSSGGPELYVWGSEDVLKGWRFANGRFDTTPFAQTTIKTPAGLCDPVGSLAISANGANAGTGILWATMPMANPDHATVPGMLYALDAETLAPLWNSGPAGSANDFGTYAKFVPPTVTNGKVYLATGSKQVVVYGLLAAAHDG
jgi:hypothetical protein